MKDEEIQITRPNATPASTARTPFQRASVKIGGIR
jgi:hypothetical protein